MKYVFRLFVFSKSGGFKYEKFKPSYKLVQNYFSRAFRTFGTDAFIFTPECLFLEMPGLTWNC